MISSKMEAQAWDSILTLVQFLERDKYASVKRSLFSWKDQEAYLVNAKETYAWRSVIDSIKAADLSEVASQLEREGKNSSSLVRSKPIMLRVAGEITNALLHSYTNHHRITFFQCDSRDPS
ncbi:MAG: hypothetical protein PXY39_00530 [archaeon]|nr:hypothetical protein [archaeon]